MSMLFKLHITRLSTILTIWFCTGTYALATQSPSITVPNVSPPPSTTLSSPQSNHPIAPTSPAVTTPDTLITPDSETLVTYFGEPLFKIYADSTIYTAAERAQIITQRIDELAHQLKIETPRVHSKGVLAYIQSGESTLMTITEADALAARLSVSQLADFYAIKLTEAIRKGQQHYNFMTLLLNSLLALFITILLGLLIWSLLRFFPQAHNWLEKRRLNILPELKIRSFVLATSEQLTATGLASLRLLRNLMILFLLYFYFPLVFSLFPWTQTLSGKLLGYLTTPLYKGWQAFVNYIPNLFVIALTIIVIHYVLKLVRLVFKALENDVISYPGFYREWAQPTFSILRFLILAFTAVALFPYLPGSDSEAFKGMSLFLGILFSLGSTSAISNMVAGVVLTYMRSFRVGDRIKIADVVGDVFAKNLLVTRIRTLKNEIVTVPNSAVLGSHITNYSSGDVPTLILHTTVTIGYDVPWPHVHELLLAAAADTPELLADPKPFVLQTSLDDFYVSYQLNAHTHYPHQMPQIYSNLHQHIQERFHAGGVEILSPHYSALRDGNQIVMPATHLPPNYEAPAFRVQPINPSEEP